MTEEQAVAKLMQVVYWVPDELPDSVSTDYIFPNGTLTEVLVHLDVVDGAVRRRIYGMVDGVTKPIARLRLSQADAKQAALAEIDGLIATKQGEIDGLNTLKDEVQLVQETVPVESSEPDEDAPPDLGPPE